MKKTITALCLAAAASWVMTVGAQTQSSTSEKAQKSTKSGKAMTYTGCLREGSTPGTYTLTNVSSTGTGGNWNSSGSSSSASGTSGSTSGSTTAGTSGSMSGESGMDKMTFELVPTRGFDLKAHVGHEIQVTGMMEREKKSSSSGSMGSGMSGSGTGTSGSGSGMSGQSGSSTSSQGMSNMEHKLRVQSVKMVSETCSGQ